MIKYLLLLLSFNAMADNDELAYEFVKSEPEIIQVAYECRDNHEITQEEFDQVMRSNLVNIILDPRQYCEDLVTKTQ
jgi:hypothetical protein